MLEFGFFIFYVKIPIAINVYRYRGRMRISLPFCHAHATCFSFYRPIFNYPLTDMAFCFTIQDCSYRVIWFHKGENERQLRNFYLLLIFLGTFVGSSVADLTGCIRVGHCCKDSLKLWEILQDKVSSSKARLVNTLIIIIIKIIMIIIIYRFSQG